VRKVAEITELLHAHKGGNANAYEQAVELLYSELRRVAHRSRQRLGGNPTMQTTAVVNEAYLKLKQADVAAEDRQHFLNIAAKAMRQIIIDYARARQAEKRGGNIVHEDIADVDKAVAAEAEELLLVDDAVQKLAAHNARLASVFEFKFYTGLDDDELATAMGLSKRTAQRDWMKARAFVGDYLSGA